MMLGRRSALVFCGFLSFVTTLALAQAAEQSADSTPSLADVALGDSALADAREGNYVRARESAQRCLGLTPSDAKCALALGMVYRRGEANFARAGFWLRRAEQLFNTQYGSPPRPGSPWRLHGELLVELIFVSSDLEDYAAQLRYIDARNQLYAPPMIAESAWPLMKMGRYDEARRAAQLGLESGDEFQAEVAWNSLCALEFEAGNQTVSYQACERAMNLHGRDTTRQSAVDFTNFAEAARGAFELERAEEASLDATRAQVAWFGNPHIDLAELYLREARYSEALAALRELTPYRLRRPVFVQESDRSESRRAVASLLLVLGRGQEAYRVAEQALRAPDRRGHVSRDPREDAIVAALLARDSARVAAFEWRLSSLSQTGWQWLQSQGQTMLAHIREWVASRSAARILLQDRSLAHKLFRIGTSKSAVLPPWLAAGLIDELGAGVALASIERARREDPRRGYGVYGSAFATEALYLSNRCEDALLEGRVAAATRTDGPTLPELEVLLRARTLHFLALCQSSFGQHEIARELWRQVLSTDPGLFVRTGVRVPVRLPAREPFSNTLRASVVSNLHAFLSDDEDGFEIRLNIDDQRIEICLDNRGAEILCHQTERTASEARNIFAGRATADFLRALMSPDVPLSQTDLVSLDGGNVSTRNPLETLRSSGILDE